MRKEIIDRRVISILRWSLIVQIIFLLQSATPPGYYHFVQDVRPVIQWVAFIPIIVVFLILILLSFNKIQDSITKPIFLGILYLIAMMTILSRNLGTTGDFRGLVDNVPELILIRGGWEMIFFLIIPLVFIAWQFSMREIVLYCFTIVVIEAIPLLFQNGEEDLFFSVLKLIGYIARSLTMLIVGWIEHQLVKVQREQQVQLVEANRELRKNALAAEKLAQTQERNRLARELHDTLAHTLSSVSVQLEATKALFDRNPSDAREMLDKTLINTKNGLKETRRTLVDLRASELESYGLTQAIRNLGISAAERSGFNISFKLDKGIDMLPNDIAHCFYRTTQEALENTLRHANADQVSISVTEREDEILLDIHDDGQGFNISEVNNQNLGIRGMRERVEMLGGNFTIQSSQSSGTSIFVNLKRPHD